MPQRTANFLLGVLGLAGLVVLVLLGADLYRSARTGPRWKRRLVAAGLVLLGWLGMAPAADKAPPLIEPVVDRPVETAVKTPQLKPDPLTSSRQWRFITLTWQRADDAASGRLGAYPFNKAGKKYIVDSLARSAKQIDELAAKDLLTAAEAGMLKAEIQTLTAAIGRTRPVGVKMPACYTAPALTPARDSMERLTARTALLAKLAAAKTLRPEVIEKATASVRRDVRTLDNPKHLARLPESKRADAVKVRDAAKKQLATIRSRLLGEAKQLDDTEAWSHIVDAWRTAVPLAASGKSTTAQRRIADRKLKAAGRAISALAVGGMLSRPETLLLRSEAARIRRRVYRNPPTDSRVTCYDMAMVPPAHQSFRRLSKRLPLLRRLAANGKVNRRVLEKVLPSVRTDIATLSDPQQAKALPGEERVQAEKTREQAAAAFARIEALLKARK